MPGRQGSPKASFLERGNAAAEPVDTPEGRITLPGRDTSAQTSSQRICGALTPLHAVKLLIHPALVPWMFCSLNQCSPQNDKTLR